MNPSLATYMKLAATAIAIAGFLFVLALDVLKGEADKQNDYMSENLNSVIEAEMNNTP